MAGIITITKGMTTAVAEEREARRWKSPALRPGFFGVYLVW